MTFLAPVPMLIAAALALPTLLAFYLLKLRRRPVRVSSTVLWRDETEDLQVNVPLRWLRNTPLLWLHLVILLLLLAALGRPAAEGAGDIPGRVIVAIDRSASMNALDGAAAGNETAARLGAAKERAKEIVASLRRGPRMPEVTVIAYAAEARVVAPPSSNPSQIERAIDLVTPTDQPGDTAAALELAGALLQGAGPGDAEEGEAPEPALLFLLSDGCNGRSGALSIAGAEVRYEPVGSQEAFHDNVGIVAGAATRDYERPSLVRLFVRLQNAGERERAVPLRLELDRETLTLTTVAVPAASYPTDANGGGSAPLERLVPGEASTTLEFEDQTGGVLRVVLARDDLLASDNAYQAVLAPPLSPGILLVHPDDRRPDPFLTDVLRELRTRSLRAVPAAEAARTLSARRDEIDLVIFDRVSPPELPPVPSITFGAPPAVLPGDGESLAADNGRMRFVTWRREHPALEYVALDTILVAQAYRLPTRQEAQDVPGLAIVPLAEGPTTPLISEIRAGPTRHLLVGFALEQSNWPVHFSFPIFIASAVDYLAGAGTGGENAARASTTTEPVLLRASGRVRLAGPVERVVEPPEPAEGAVSVGVLERTGVYEVQGADGERAVAVNLLDPIESLVIVDPSIRVAGRDVPGGEGAAVGPRELWPWFVLAVAVLLALEWMLFAWKMRA